MKVALPRKMIRSLFRWTQHILLFGGTLLTGYVVLVVADSMLFQYREGLELDREFNPEFKRTELPGPPAEAGLMGRIEIERLGLSVIVAEGQTPATLRRAAGHIPGTGLPGQPGNVGISAHRDTFFRPLRNIQPDDLITLTTLQGVYTYRVVSTQVVSPTDVSVLAPTEEEVLTLVTCHPFYYVGASPNRFIVRAERIPL